MEQLVLGLRRSGWRLTVVALASAVLLSACTMTIPQTAAEDDHFEQSAEMPEEVAEVSFPISCASETQEDFNRGVAYLHSFWFAPALEAFEHVVEVDPTCGMAYWGQAMVHQDIPWSPTPEQGLVEGWAAIEKAMGSESTTPRERAYIEAAAALYADADSRDHSVRTGAYAEAMRNLVQQYPDDIEAKVFYALALLMTAPRDDLDYANQTEAAEILEPLLVEFPEHPGVAHYLVHSYDYPSRAESGLTAAQRFAEVAPAAPHALHMPAHIFTRLGYWPESVATNEAAAEAAKASAPENHVPGRSSESALHAMDYMMYGFLQMAEDQNAEALLDDVLSIETVDPAGFGAAYALAAMPARYTLERGQWADAANLALSPADFPWDRFPHAQAALVFARGLGAARSGDVEAAKEDVEQLIALREGILAANQGYWAGQADIQIEIIRAWIAFADGQTDEALEAMRNAVAMEAVTEKHPVTPGPILPARELLGEMLLEVGQPEEALAAFEASQEIEPGRFRGLYGAAHAAELAGDIDRATMYFEELNRQVSAGNSERTELQAAEAFLSQ